MSRARQWGSHLRPKMARTGEANSDAWNRECQVVQAPTGPIASIAHCSILSNPMLTQITGALNPDNG